MAQLHIQRRSAVRSMEPWPERGEEERQPSLWGCLSTPQSWMQEDGRQASLRYRRASVSETGWTLCPWQLDRPISALGRRNRHDGGRLSSYRHGDSVYSVGPKPTVGMVALFICVIMPAAKSRRSSTYPTWSAMPASSFATRFSHLSPKRRLVSFFA